MKFARNSIYTLLPATAAFAVVLAVVLAFATFNTATAEDENAAPPVAVVELFTSQGCYSCPPAEKVLRTAIAPASGVVALEMHVDYWDDLVYFGSSWEDPYSNNQYTRRQQGYNLKLRDTNSVYTPQAVIQGHAQTGGTSKDLILHTARQSLDYTPKARLYFSGGKGEDPLAVTVKGTLAPGVLLTYAMYWKERTTDVLRGENKGKTLQNTNVVYELTQLPPGKRQVVLPDYNPETQSCAVWLQRGYTGQIISAAKCPSGA